MDEARKPGELSTLTGYELAGRLSDLSEREAELLAQADHNEKELARAETVLVWEPGNKQAQADRILYRSLVRRDARHASAFRRENIRITALMKLCKI